MNRIIHGVQYSTWLIGQVIVGAFVIVFDVIRVRSQMHPAVVEYLHHHDPGHVVVGV